ncbi:MAG TPA: hypothetical protein VF610_07355 [Segetibacter sp.]
MPIILEKWEVLINTSLNPLNASKLSSSCEAIKGLVAESELEREKVRNLLIEGVIDRQKIMDKQQYVQVVQAMLIRLLDKLHFYKETKGLETSLVYLYNAVSQHLEEVLNFIEDFFSNYFDRNEKVPTPYLLISIEELCKQLEQLQALLEVNEAIDRELTDILVQNFKAFCSIKSSGPTYNELLYQKDLMSELLSDNVLASESSISEVLFYFNFNEDDYVAYLFNKLKAVTETYNSNKEKIAALRYEQKTINQLSTKLNCYLSPYMPPLKEQVNCWIEEEIKFLQTEPAFPLPAIEAKEVGNKIETSLSVSKLALLVRLMVIDKVITNRVVAQVLRVVIRTVATSQSENIGFSSFESKYHKTDKGTITAVKDMLFRWINILNQL